MFYRYSRFYKITTVEIVDSEKIKIYYSIFINTMAAIARDFDGTIIKNTGDSLIYYFPKTMSRVGNGDVTNFKSVFECGLTMIPSRYIRPVYPGIGTVTSTKTTPASDVPNIHKCDICGNSDFKTEDELSYHVRTIH